MTVALCLMTLNEIDGCKHDVPLIDRSKFDQIFCMDGGSTDGTVAYLESENIEIYSQQKKGLNCACIEAVEKCRCDAIIFFHPKGTIPVEDTYKFRRYFEHGYEMIVASRMLRDSHNEEDDKLFKPRKWFGLGLAFVATILFQREGYSIKDSLHGFRAITVDAFKKMNISERNPSVDIEMVCRSYKLRIKRGEFATTEIPRVSGNTHFKALPVGWVLIKYIVWELFR